MQNYSGTQRLLTPYRDGPERHRSITLIPDFYHLNNCRRDLKGVDVRTPCQFRFSFIGNNDPHELMKKGKIASERHTNQWIKLEKSIHLG